MALRNRPTAQELRYRVAFDGRPMVDDGWGNQVHGDFGEVFSCRAAFRPAGGSETVIAARLEGRQVLHVYVRPSQNTRKIKTDWQMRVTSHGVETKFNINAVDAVTDPRWVYLQVESGVPA